MTSTDSAEIAASEPPMVPQIDPSWFKLLEPCAREDAEKATVIRRALKQKIGRWRTDMVLCSYKETCLRIGPCGRYFVDKEGRPMRLVRKSALKE